MSYGPTNSSLTLCSPPQDAPNDKDEDVTLAVFYLCGVPPTVFL